MAGRAKISSVLSYNSISCPQNSYQTFGKKVGKSNVFNIKT